jgi:ribosomal protein S18 acetylase RimI-like enzyme
MSAQWSEGTVRYQLADGFGLGRAEPAEFAVYQTIYRSADAVFLQNWERSLSMIADSQFLAPRIFWIEQDQRPAGERRIGGVIIAPNIVSNLILLPPFADIDAILRQLKKLLLQWSDLRLDIIASSVLPDQVEHYERRGFRRSEVNRCMIRPTERFEVSWEDDLRLSRPLQTEEDDLTRLFYQSFRELGLGEQTMDSRRGAVRHYLSRYAEVETLGRASTCVRDAASGQLIAACLISLWEKWPLVFDVAVHPGWRGRGIATRMLKGALNALAGEYPALRLFVAVGNEAEALYRGLGFLAGPALTNLRLCAPKSE